MHDQDPQAEPQVPEVSTPANAGAAADSGRTGDAEVAARTAASAAAEGNGQAEKPEQGDEPGQGEKLGQLEEPGQAAGPEDIDEAGPADGSARHAGLDTSAPAIAATIALVAFSIFIGVVGPRLGNRQPLPPGTTLVELADAMTVRHSESVVGAIHATDEPPFERAEIEREFARILGREVAVPDLRIGLEPMRFQWAGIRGVRLPGASGACAFARFRGDDGPDFASVAVLRDRGDFIVFDPHGRPIPLPEGEVFSVAVEGREFGSTVLAYREGELVFALQADSAAALERFAARFRAAAVERSLERGDGGAPEGTAAEGSARDPAESPRDR